MKPLVSLLLAATLIVPVAHLRAGEVAMGGGRIGFHVPDAWTDIMDAQGDTEMRVYQVPGAPAGTLARIGVAVREVGDFTSFEHFESEGQRKAGNLPGFRLTGDKREHSYAYTAREGNTTYAYLERYFYRGSLAVQLRCARPTGATKAWTARFDQACDSVAADVQR